MITNFEEITENLNEKDLLFLPVVIDALKRCETPQLSNVVCDLIQTIHWNKTEVHIPFTGNRLRKFVNHIRVNGMLPVIATHKGYFVSYDKEKIKKQMQSLYERASAQRKAADGLKTFIDENN